MDLPKFKISDSDHSPFILMPDQSMDELSILWNTGQPTSVLIDEHTVDVNTNCIIFVSEFYMKLETTGGFRIIQFDKTFLGPVNSLFNSGEYLMIFYGQHAISHLPKITLRENEAALFESIFSDLLSEAENTNNPILEALLRNSFQRFLLQSQRIHMETEFDIPIDFKDLKTIREFQYLVNMHFREFAKVADYAQIMRISPKRISQLFSSCYRKNASELIADRRNLYAKRQLIHTDELIKNIAYELNFSDSQTFSHFFKRQNSISPEKFRNKMRSHLISYGKSNTK